MFENGIAGNNVTISDVARACGVSKTTISRYLNGRFDYFSEETRERISQVIDELGYNPNKSAQRLKASKTRLIGCLIGDIGSPFAGLLLKGITKTCEQVGYQVLFAQSDDNPEKELQMIEGLLANRVDGLIVNTCGNNDEYLFSIAQRRIPLVLADRGLLSGIKIDTVEHSNEESAIDCVRFLKECGYEDIAFFSIEMGTVSPRIKRYRGYLEAMAQYYPDVPTKKFEFKPENEQACIDAVQSFYKGSGGSRLAILSANGVTAEKIALTFTKIGWTFGRNFGLCTFDDWEWMKLNPGITAVSMQTEETGSMTARLLLEIINGDRKMGSEPVDIRLPGKLIIRGSTKE